MTSITPEALRAAILAKLTYAVGKDAAQAQRPRLVRRHRAGGARPRRRPLDRTAPRGRRAAASKRVYYLSLEFLIGRLLSDALGNLQLYRRRAARRSPSSASISTGCASSSPTRRSATAASAGSPPASWRAWRRVGIAGLRLRHPLRARPVPAGDPRRLAGRAAGGLAGVRQSVGVRAARGRLRGRLRRRGRVLGGADGTARGHLASGRAVLAVAYDTPIVGWRGRHVNTLRLWSARAADPLRLDHFNRGDYVGARRRAGPRRERSRACSTRRRHAGRPGTAAAAGISSSPRPRCRTCVRRHLQQYGDLATLPDTRRSSSTTPIRRSPSPS